MNHDRAKDRPASLCEQVQAQVCLCLTPLHVLTVAAIVSQRGLRFALGWYVCAVDTPQHRAYASRMERCCDEVRYVVESTSDGRGLKKYVRIAGRRFRLRQEFLQHAPRNVDQAFIPSSLSDYCYVFVSAVRCRRLVTFDDGWSNVQPDSPLTQVHTRWSTRLLNAMTGISVLPERIPELSTRHFSIYSLPNHAHRVEVISLLPAADTAAPKVDAEASMQRLSYLVGPAPEAAPAVYAAIADLLGKVRIDGVFAHPRDTLRKINGVPYVDTSLIVEDYVFRLLVERPQAEIDVYGYESSVLLNLAHVPRVRAFTICRPGAERAQAVAAMVSGGVLRFSLSPGSPELLLSPTGCGEKR
ncbi:MAG: hypothetical protein CFE40_09395 [Burkholderiales bacterium PBB1]|nr:MAG: hypothetical protein CFE40_09395 [Burkholderiales bacterium PBB1]